MQSSGYRFSDIAKKYGLSNPLRLSNITTASGSTDDRLGAIKEKYGMKGDIHSVRSLGTGVSINLIAPNRYAYPFYDSNGEMLMMFNASQTTSSFTPFNNSTNQPHNKTLSGQSSTVGSYVVKYNSSGNILFAHYAHGNVLSVTENYIFISKSILNTTTSFAVDNLDGTPSSFVTPTNPSNISKTYTICYTKQGTCIAVWSPLDYGGESGFYELESGNILVNVESLNNATTLYNMDGTQSSVQAHIANNFVIYNPNTKQVVSVAHLNQQPHYEVHNNNLYVFFSSTTVNTLTDFNGNTLNVNGVISFVHYNLTTGQIVNYANSLSPPFQMTIRGYNPDNVMIMTDSDSPSAANIIYNLDGTNTPYTIPVGTRGKTLLYDLTTQQLLSFVYMQIINPVVGTGAGLRPDNVYFSDTNDVISIWRLQLASTTTTYQILFQTNIDSLTVYEKPKDTSNLKFILVRTTLQGKIVSANIFDTGLSLLTITKNSDGRRLSYIAGVNTTSTQNTVSLYGLNDRSSISAPASASRVNLYEIQIS